MGIFIIPILTNDCFAAEALTWNKKFIWIRWKEMDVICDVINKLSYDIYLQNLKQMDIFIMNESLFKFSYYVINYLKADKSYYNLNIWHR